MKKLTTMLFIVIAMTGCYNKNERVVIYVLPIDTDQYGNGMGFYRVRYKGYQYSFYDTIGKWDEGDIIK